MAPGLGFYAYDGCVTYVDKERQELCTTKLLEKKTDAVAFSEEIQFMVSSKGTHVVFV